MRILGIDFGTKRVGLAVSDEMGQFALPLTIVENKPSLVAEIAEIASDNDTNEVVIGESRDYKGAPNKIFTEANNLKKALEKRGLKVHLEPEFMTSMQAERFQGKHAKLDASAAALILQSYLDKLAVQKQKKSL